MTPGCGKNMRIIYSEDTSQLALFPKNISREILSTRDCFVFIEGTTEDMELTDTTCGTFIGC